jgi:methylglutaconyl-CoA hydratase
MSDLIRLSQYDRHIALLTLNNPNQRNALNTELVLAMHEALRNLADDQNLRILLVTGSGDAFCAGADLKGLRAMQNADREDNLENSQKLADLFSAVWHFPLPVIGLINGPAIAGGLGLVSCFDYNIALNQADTIFRFSEVRIGFVPAIIANFLLRKICPQDARWLLLSGETLSLDKAISVGLIQAITDKDLLTYGIALAQKLIRSNSAAAMRQTKRLLRKLDDLPLSEGLSHAVETNADARSTEDCRRGIAAFLNKEKIDWTSF